MEDNNSNKKYLFQKIFNITSIVVLCFFFIQDFYFYADGYASKVESFREIMRLIFVGTLQQHPTEAVYFPFTMVYLVCFVLIVVLLVRNTFFGKKHDFSIFAISTSFSISKMVFSIFYFSRYGFNLDLLFVIIMNTILIVSLFLLAALYGFYFFRNIKMDKSSLDRVSFLLKSLIVLVVFLGFYYLCDELVIWWIGTMAWGWRADEELVVHFFMLCPSPIFIFFFLSIALIVVFSIYKSRIRKIVAQNDSVVEE